MFHWKDGWFFERVARATTIRYGTHIPGAADTAQGMDDLGVVHILKRETAHADSPIVFEAFIPAPEWASIVASVSVQGETSHTWPLAVAFHMGGEPLVPSR